MQCGPPRCRDRRARSRKGGRKLKLSPAQVTVARRLYGARDHTVEQIAAMFGATRQTIYRHLDENQAAAR